VISNAKHPRATAAENNRPDAGTGGTGAHRPYTGGGTGKESIFTRHRVPDRRGIARKSVRSVARMEVIVNAKVMPDAGDVDNLTGCELPCRS
jgi:hypothetical protein